MSTTKKRTVEPPTGAIAAEFKIRACVAHRYPVGLISETSREPFICLLKFHRMEIDNTVVLSSNLLLLPQLMKRGPDPLLPRKEDR